MHWTAYSLIWALTFLVVGVAAAAAWLLVDQKPDEADSQPDLLQRERLSALSALALVLGRLRVSEKLKRMIAEADLEWSVGRLTLTMLVGGSVSMLAASRLDWIPWFGVLVIGLALAAAPLLYVSHQRAERLKAVEQQLPEALEFISRASVAGHSLPMAMELSADEIGRPLSLELRKTVDEYNLGLPMERALENLAKRVPSVDIQFFTSAISTQSRTGGSLHELLENLSETIRERETLRGQVRTLTANGRMTAIVLTSLPFFIAAVLTFVNGEYMLMLFEHPVGRTLLFVGLCSQVAAFFVIRWIADIKP